MYPESSREDKQHWTPVRFSEAPHKKTRQSYCCSSKRATEEPLIIRDRGRRFIYAVGAAKRKVVKIA